MMVVMEENMSHGTFATQINCMDGRTQEPALKWIKEKFGVDYVDNITEPGPDKILAQGIQPNLDSIKARAMISVYKHGSRNIVIVAHHDCAGNPVCKKEHADMVHKAVEVVRSWGLPASVQSVWIDRNWHVKEI